MNASEMQWREEGGEALGAPCLVSVIIPVRDGAMVIGDQLEALSGQSFSGSWEVVVADNGSTDRTRAVVESFSGRLPGLRIVDAGARRGPSHARNVGAREAAGDVYLFVDADDVVAPGWLQAMVLALAHADAVVSTDQPVDRKDSSRTSFRRAAAKWAWGRGGNLGIRSEIFATLRGWDEQRRTGEDVEFCLRLQREGYRLDIAPEAKVHYRAPADLRSLARQRFEFGSAAPELYEKFDIDSQFLRTTARDLTWMATRSPYILCGSRLRGRWVAFSAGLMGRLWGELMLRRPRFGPNEGGWSTSRRHRGETGTEDSAER